MAYSCHHSSGFQSNYMISILQGELSPSEYRLLLLREAQAQDHDEERKVRNGNVSGHNRTAMSAEVG
jgi:hypothetical protein